MEATASEFWFSGVKWVGVVYLAYLGIRMLRSSGTLAVPDEACTAERPSFAAIDFVVMLAYAAAYAQAIPELRWGPRQGEAAGGGSGPMSQTINTRCERPLIIRTTPSAGRRTPPFRPRSALNRSVKDGDHGERRGQRR